MLARRCVACGCAVPASGSMLPSCLACGCDFQDRPPRSYAEMEGLVPVIEVDRSAATALERRPADESTDASVDDGGRRAVARMRRRWAVVVLLMTLAAAALLALAAQAAP